MAATPKQIALNPLDPGSLDAALNWRYVVKAFDASCRIEPALWAALENSLVMSLSSYGMQPWTFLVITDAALRTELRPHSWNQSQITDASHLVLFLAKRLITPADVDQLNNAICSARGCRQGHQPKLFVHHTQREREVLACLAAGDNNRAIAQRLGIGEGTVRSHVHVLLQKLQVSNRTQAALIWLAARGLPLP